MLVVRSGPDTQVADAALAGRGARADVVVERDREVRGVVEQDRGNRRGRSLVGHELLPFMRCSPSAFRTYRCAQLVSEKERFVKGIWLIDEIIKD